MKKTIKSSSTSRLARQLTLYVVLASTFITIFTSAFQLFEIYKTHISRIELRLNEIRDSYSGNIASRLWIANQQELVQALQGILRLQDIEYVEVYEDNKLISQQGNIPTSDTIERNYPLKYTYQNRVQTIGRIHISASLTNTYQTLIDQALTIIVSNAVKTFLISGFMLFLFYRFIARHLLNITHHANKISIDNLEQRILLDRNENDSQHQDEFDVLVEAIHTMQTNLEITISNLSKNEKNLELTLNSIADAVIVTDEKGLITRMNPVAESLTGYSFNEAKGKLLKIIFPIIDANTRNTIENPVEKILSSGKAVFLSNHTTLISKDGIEYQISDSAAPIFNEKNKILGIVLIFSDVTEQYHLRQSVIKIKRDLQAIMDHSPAVIYVKDTEGHYSFINYKFEKLFHIHRDAIIGKTDYDIFPKDIADQFNRNDKDVFKAKHALELEEVVPQDDGQHNYISAKFPLYNEDNNIYALCGISTDITERKKMENLLRDNAERFTRWKESNFIGILQTKANGKVIDANNALLNMLGYTSQDLHDNLLDWTKFTPAEFLHLDEIALNEAATKGYWTPFEKEYFHKDGSRVPILIGGSIFHKEHDEFIVFVIDLSEQKQQEEKIQRSQKMDALGKLTGGIAHDYNNMLSIIIGYSELLRSALIDQPTLAGYASDIHHASVRGAKLTKKLLAFSRQSTKHAEKTNINEILNDQQHMLEKTMTARIQFVLDLAQNLWPVWIDSSDLEDTVVNLCINAMHAIKGNGHITVKTSNKKIDTSNARVLDLEPGDYVLLSITDTGIGMNTTTKDKIFDPFFSTKGELGTGLGLSQVFGFVKRSDGIITVSSEPNHGTKFELYFPRYNNDNIESLIETNNTESDNSGNETILIVDDEPALSRLTSLLLNEEGYKTICADDGPHALKIMEQESIDLMLSDVIMPEMDGYQLATIVQNKYPDIKIQLASGFSEDRHLDTVVASLHENLLNKPYKIQDLLINIRSLLDK